MRHALAFSVTLALLLTGCSSSQTPAPAGGTAPTTPPTAAPAAKPTTAPVQAPAPTAAAAARRGGTVRLPVQTMATFNSLFARGSDAVYINRLVFSGLTRLDTKGEPQPDLATKWTPSADGLTWTFELNPKATFQDGRPVTAQDVKYTFDAATNKDYNSFHRADLPTLQQVDAVNATTVAFKFSAAEAWFPYLVAEEFGILPSHVFGTTDPSTNTDFNTKNPIGSGPYRVTEAAEGSHMTLKRWDEYWGTKPLVDTFIFRVLPDANAQVAQLQAGELDIAITVPSTIAAVKGNPNLAVDVMKQATTLMINYNHTRPALQDKRVRQALIYGLDRQLIIDKVSQGVGIFATGPVTQDLVNYYNAEIPPRGYDPARAKALLEEAGWKDANGDGVREKDGTPLAMMLLVDKGNPTREQVALTAQQYYGQLGVKVDLQVLERSVFAARLIRGGDFDAYVSNRSYSSFAGRLARFWATSSGTNLGSYSNAEVDKLFVEGQAEFDPIKRQATYKKLQQVFEEDAPLTIVYFDPELIARKASLVAPKTALSIALNWPEEWYYQ